MGRWRSRLRTELSTVASLKALYAPLKTEASGHINHHSAVSGSPNAAFGDVRSTLYARQVGLNYRDYSGYSLRSGFLTSAARRGASISKMRDVSRHKSMDILQSDVRDAELFRDHAGAGLL